jgi:acetoin utilization protein AcuB
MMQKGGSAMRIRDWMTREVHTIKPLDSISHARGVLETQRVNQLPVAVNHKLVGIVTDRDLRDAFPSVFEAPGFNGGGHPPERNPDDIRVEEVMSRTVFTLGPDDSVEEAAKLMRRERVGALPIIDKGHLVGILTRSDVLDAHVASVAANEPV